MYSNFFYKLRCNIELFESVFFNNFEFDALSKINFEFLLEIN